MALPCTPFESGWTDISTPSAGVAVHWLTESNESNTIVVGAAVVAATACACACNVKMTVLKSASMTKRPDLEAEALIL
jgi:hypothetical protein